MADGGDQRRRVQYANSRYLTEPATGVVAPGGRGQLGIEGFNPPIAVAPFRPQVFDQAADTRRQARLIVGEDSGNARLQDPPPLGNHDPALEQDCPKLVDQCRVPTHKPLPDPVDRL
jgi:hypothetical protein